MNIITIVMIKEEKQKKKKRIEKKKKKERIHTTYHLIPRFQRIGSMNGIMSTDKHTLYSN